MTDHTPHGPTPHMTSFVAGMPDRPLETAATALLLTFLTLLLLAASWALLFL